MSVFDYPRINVQGTIRLDPGTANNDDYAASVTFNGEALGLIDSKNVAARTYGMSDTEFLAWVQKAHAFPNVEGGGTSDIIPAEWNYYGDMSMQADSIKCVGTQAGTSGIDLSSCLGADLTLNGCFTDINPEGSPPATQFFIKKLILGSDLISAELSKGVGQWINFYRNVNLNADAGAGASVYHGIAGATVNIPGWETLGASGVIFRYYLSRALLENPETGTTNEQIEALYETGTQNPKILELVGTFAPLYATETIVAAPTGRLMTWDTPNITTPPENSNNGPGGKMALGPCVLHQNGDMVTADFSGTFPDNYDANGNGDNPKFDFGPVSLVAELSGQRLGVWPVDYADTAQGNAAGWLFDFDVSAIPPPLLADATFKLISDTFGDVLAEVAYYFVSNQQAIYGEQGGSDRLFLNNGTNEPATIAVFHRGVELTPQTCPDITVWQYASTPLQSPGDAVPISTTFKPGDSLVVDTNLPGNFLFTFTVEGASPPTSYNQFMNPPYVTNSPQISLRILPNEDYDAYFVDPNAEFPVANDLLTFEFLYDHVLRVFYLLYPVMHPFLPLNSEEKVAQYAASILQRTDPAPSNWLSNKYMPPTRDLSNSRRKLLQAWCRKALQGD